MKSSNKIISLFSLAIILSLLSSCSQNIFDVADRYKVVFWFDEATSRQLLDDGADSLFIYSNFKLIASTSVDDVFWTTAPSCDDSNAIAIQLDLLRKEVPINYTVKDQTGFVYFNGTNYPAIGTCNAIKIGPITTFK